MTPVEIALAIGFLAICLWAVAVNGELRALKDLTLSTSQAQTRADRRHARLRTKVQNIDADLDALAKQIDAKENPDWWKGIE